MGLYQLRQFFQHGAWTGRAFSGFQSDRENVEEATRRNLLMLSEAELLRLREGSWKLAEFINRELVERVMDPLDHVLPGATVRAADAILEIMEGPERRRVRR